MQKIDTIRKSFFIILNISVSVKMITGKKEQKLSCSKTIQRVFEVFERTMMSPQKDCEKVTNKIKKFLQNPWKSFGKFLTGS